MMKRILLIVLIVVMFNSFLVMQASADVATGINGELRLRPEYRENADFDKTAPDTQSFYNQRIRLGFNARINSDLSGFVQLQDSRIWGADALITDSLAVAGNTNEGVDLHQGYVVLGNISGLPLSLKVGRQEIAYGDQRLVGSFGWSNQGRAFDAIRLMYMGDIADIDFWTAKVTENNSCGGGVGCTASPANKSGQDIDFYGIYSTLKDNPVPDSNLQAYLLYKRDGATGLEGKINLSEYTLGARLGGKVSEVGIDYTGEFAYQFGTNANAKADDGTTKTKSVDIAAYAFAVEAGYSIPGIAWNPRVAVEYDSATGSKSVDKDTTFDQLYPTNHALYGYMDYQGWMNMNDITLKLSTRPSDKSFYYLAYHMLSLAEKKDAWYGADGKARTGFGSSASNSKDAVGHEVDLLARYTVNQNLKLEAGVSEFFKGDFIEAKVANSENSTWAYLMGTVSF